jgi:hypothetical protein
MEVLQKIISVWLPFSGDSGFKYTAQANRKSAQVPKKNSERILVRGFTKYEPSGTEHVRQAESRLLASMKEFVLLNVDGELQN